MYTDATCYKSEMCYLTDQKLLWKRIEKVYMIIYILSTNLNVHCPRTKYVDVEKANLLYRKQRRHTKGLDQEADQTPAQPFREATEGDTQTGEGEHADG